MAIKPIAATTGPNTKGKDQARLLGMELMPHTATHGDMSPVSDLFDTNIFASSPNSLYMYDQEKMDMQSSLGGNSMCSLVDMTSFNDEFELSSNYEVSQDICCLEMKEIPNKSYTIPSGGGWDTKEQIDMFIKTEPICDECNPTLAELNLNLDLLEDIDSYINFELRSKVPESQLSMVTEMEEINQEQQEVSNKVCESTSPCSSNSTVRTTSDAIYQNTYMPKINIKQEPADSGDRLGRNCQMSLTQLLMSPLPNSKGLGLGTTPIQPINTIHEIDISDKHKLLPAVSNRSRELLQATVPKKRPVSDSSVDPCYKHSAPKCPVSLTGLNSMDLKWEEIKKFLHADAPSNSEASSSCTPQVSLKNERKRCVSDSSSSAVTLTSNEDAESDSDKDYDDFSDSDLDCRADIKFLSATESLIGPNEKQHFWQYNVQSKGPKGTRVHFDMEEDPHVLHDFEDPVFDPVNSDNLSGIDVTIKHGRKARKGDGNDIVPSPKKLCQIGLQLQTISRQINDFVPVNKLPSAARSKTRKEKNKLASRACRLKKKAQHEANKVKLNGLEMEHRKLLTVICHTCRYLHDRLNSKSVIGSDQLSMTNTLQTLIMEHLGTMVAGNTAEYVNSVIHKVEAGDLTGGLLIQATRSYPKELHK